MSGLAFGLRGFWFRVHSLEFQGFRLWGLRVKSLGFRVQSLGFGVYSFGFGASRSEFGASRLRGSQSQIIRLYFLQTIEVLPKDFIDTRI